MNYTENMNNSEKLTDHKSIYMLLRIGNIILWIFVITTSISIWHYVPVLVRAAMELDLSPLFDILLVAVGELMLFWIGIILVYLTSRQLGFKTRILGIIFGLIPVVNLIMLIKILRITGREAKTELARCKRNKLRVSEQVCRTKYPLLLVHGVFFRDFEHFNYWGRIPDELRRNGATIYYGEHQSADCVDDSAKELEKRILQIIRENGYEKLNVIAHSKGGLDMRTALSKTSVDLICARPFRKHLLHHTSQA